MKESTTYQAILKEGRVEGRLEGQLQTLRETLLDLLSDRFGPLPAVIVATISIAGDQAKLQTAIRSVAKLATLAEFQL